MRIAAVDYGRRRVGLAVCDPLGITVRGLDTLERRSGGDLADAATAVAVVLREEGPQRVVVGLPLHDDGSESDMSREARAFGAALAATLPVEIVFHDESLTSWEAEEALKSGRKRLRDARRAGDVDRAAAVGLLRSYLRTLDSSPPP